MLNRKRFVIYFKEYVSTRSLDKFDSLYHKALRKGITPDEQDSFFAFLSTKNGYTNKSNEDIADELKDAARPEEDLLHWDEYKVDTGETTPEGYPKWIGPITLLCLGLRGRRITDKNFISRWAYFLQYVHEEHAFIYGVLYALGVVGIGFVATHVDWSSILSTLIRSIKIGS